MATHYSWQTNSLTSWFAMSRVHFKWLAWLECSSAQ